MPEIRGIGVDLCAVSRMEKLLTDDRFLNRYFDAEEKAYIKGRGKSAAQTMAGLFASKEALLKALGTGLFISMREVCILHEPSGRPYYSLSGAAAEALDGGALHLSITHEGDMACAFCIWESRRQG